MLTVNINERTNLASEAANGYQLVVNAGDGASLGVHLTHRNLVATLR